MRKVVILFIAISFLIPFINAQSNLTPDQEKRIQELEKICNEQAKEIKELQKKLGLLNDENKEYTEKIVKEYLQKEQLEEEQGIVAGYDDGFFIRSADGDFEFKTDGYIQAGIGIFENQTFDNNSFFLNGVELKFHIYIYKIWHAKISVDFASPVDPINKFADSSRYEIDTEDAYMEYIGMDEFKVRVGNFHVPFTIAGQYDKDEGITIWSEPFITSWSHGRDPGIMIYGLINDMVEYRLSLHNGEGSMELNNTDDFLFAASARIYYFGYSNNPNSFIHVGVIRGRDNNLHESGDVNSATILTQWGRQIFDGDDNNPHGSTGFEEDSTQGWKTGVDAGLKFVHDLDNGSNIRVEGEFMYIRWERNFDTGRMSPLEGWGASFGFAYRHCLNPDIEGSGIVPSFMFSYTDVDNIGDNDGINDVRGQRVFSYTFGLGYAFNKYLFINFNWIILDIDRVDLNPPKDRTDGSDDLEHAWFVQVTTTW